jgi:hypothetical protein
MKNTKKFKDFFEAWYFLEEHSYYRHPKYHNSFFQRSLDIEVVKVNPKTECIDDNEQLNIVTRIWLESGINWINKETYESTHDWKLDCGGKTFEEAIINLANLVLKHYGKSKT